MDREGQCFVLFSRVFSHCCIEELLYSTCYCDQHRSLVDRAVVSFRWECEMPWIEALGEFDLKGAILIYPENKEWIWTWLRLRHPSEGLCLVHCLVADVDGPSEGLGFGAVHVIFFSHLEFQEGCCWTCPSAAAQGPAPAGPTQGIKRGPQGPPHNPPGTHPHRRVHGCNILDPGPPAPAPALIFSPSDSLRTASNLFPPHIPCAFPTLFPNPSWPQLHKLAYIKKH